MVSATRSKAVENNSVTPSERVLDVRNLQVSYHTPRGLVRAVNGVSFFLRPSEKLGLVGESGSGKTTTALSLMRLIQAPAVIEGGEVWLDGQDLLSLTEEEMRQARSADIALIPQGAMNSLNPVMKIGEQLRDTIKSHMEGESRASLDARIQEVLEWVELRPTVMEAYPHELSGGMKQRVCIAMGILLSPKVIIADEPTSALDVVVQRQVMETLGRVQRDLGASVILVGHDMGLMAQFVDRVGVMYGGKLVEVGVPSHCSIAPIIPAITDEFMEEIVVRAAALSVPSIGWIPLRLPHEVAPLFREWLAVHFPERGDKVMSIVRSIRGGRDNDPQFFSRMKPSGVWADLFRARFRVAIRRAGIGKLRFELDCTQFRPPAVGGQLRLL